MRQRFPIQWICLIIYNCDVYIFFYLFNILFQYPSNDLYLTSLIHKQVYGSIAGVVIKILTKYNILECRKFKICVIVILIWDLLVICLVFFSSLNTSFVYFSISISHNIHSYTRALNPFILYNVS